MREDDEWVLSPLSHQFHRAKEHKMVGDYLSADMKLNNMPLERTNFEAELSAEISKLFEKITFLGVFSLLTS